MKTKLIFIGLLFITILTNSCNQNDNGKPKDFDYGHIENNIYSNSFFGLKIQLPSYWIVQTQEQTEALVTRGKNIVAGDDKNIKASINASEINSASLLILFKYEVGADVDHNPSFMLLAENIKHAPGIKNGGDYLLRSRKLLTQAEIQYDYIDEDFKKEMISNREFYLMNCSISYMGHNIKQKYYCSIQDGFCLSVVISFVDDEHKKDLENIINSMEFTK